VQLAGGASIGMGAASIVVDAASIASASVASASASTAPSRCPAPPGPHATTRSSEPRAKRARGDMAASSSAPRARSIAAAAL
jgi:hypothetical protein